MGEVESGVEITRFDLVYLYLYNHNRDKLWKDIIST